MFNIRFRHRLRSKTGFTLMELLVVMGIVTLLVALLMPAIQTARESARRSQCINNLKQIGIALHSYHEVYRSLPPGYVSEWDVYHADIGQGWGWAAMLLPGMEEATTFDAINFSLNVEDNANLTVRRIRVGSYLCPTDDMPETFPASRDVIQILYGQLHEWHDVICYVPGANYVGVFGIGEPGVDGDGIFYRNSRVRTRDIRDGLSTTLAVGERAINLNFGRGMATWVGSATPAFMYSCGPNHTDPDAIGNCIQESASGMVLGHTGEGCGPGDVHGDSNQFSSQHGPCSHFLFADGHVGLLHASMDYLAYKALSTREGREITDGDGL